MPGMPVYPFGQYGVYMLDSQSMQQWQGKQACPRLQEALPKRTWVALFWWDDVKAWPDVMVWGDATVGH